MISGLIVLIVVLGIYGVIVTRFGFKILDGWTETLDHWDETIVVNDELIALMTEILGIPEEGLPTEQQIHDYLVKVRGE